MNPFHRGRRGRWIFFLAVVAVAVAGAAVLAAYALTRSPSARVTVTGGEVVLQEGRSTFGTYWFTPPTDNLSGAEQGFPITIAPGTLFRIAVPISNTDTRAHSIDSVSTAPPFSVAGTSVPLPVEVPAHEDTTLYVNLTAPATSGTYSFTVTVTCLS